MGVGGRVIVLDGAKRNDFAQFAILIAYPLAVIRALASFRFFPALQLHIYMMVVFGLYYCWRVRKLPKEEKVGPLAFLTLSLLMPITYALLTPLALFTLDSGSWETRGHEGETAEPITDIAPTLRNTNSPSKIGIPLRMSLRTSGIEEVSAMPTPLRPPIADNVPPLSVYTWPSGPMMVGT